MNKGPKNNDWKILLLIFIGILSFPMLLTAPYIWKLKFFDFSETGQIGDTIGGITAPFIGLLSAVLVYLSFLKQSEANKLISDQFKTQRTLDIENEQDYEKLISRNNKEIPRKGELSKRWNYAFHGCECGFYNKKNKQQVEVVLSNRPKFGHIDSWFLLAYMESTDKYKKEVEGINWQQLKPLIEKLYETGEIEYLER